MLSLMSGYLLAQFSLALEHPDVYHIEGLVSAGGGGASSSGASSALAKNQHRRKEREERRLQEKGDKKKDEKPGTAQRFACKGEAG